MSVPLSATTEGDGGDRRAAGERWTQLLVRAGGGDKAAFTELMELSERVVWGVAFRVTGDAALADDVANETFERLWSRRGTFDPAKSSGKGWVLTVAQRLALDYAEKNRRHWLTDGPRDEEAEQAAEPADGDAVPPPELADRAFTGPLVREALARLDPRDRAALVLCHIDGLSYDEIAQALGCTVAAVGPRLTRARERLRRALDPHARL